MVSTLPNYYTLCRDLFVGLDPHDSEKDVYGQSLHNKHSVVPNATELEYAFVLLREVLKREIVRSHMGAFNFAQLQKKYWLFLYRLVHRRLGDSICCCED